MQDGTMMNSAVRKSVFGVASSRIQASRIVNHLANAGFSRDDISVSISGQDMGLGLIPGRFTGAEALPASRFENFMAGGPISGVLGGASIAPASLENMNHRHGNRADDHLLICLQADDCREADAARKIFQAMGATNITVGGEKASRLLGQTFQRFEAEPELQSFS
jgi:hypothetical protein